MKKTTIHIPYEEDKLAALHMYLAQKNLSLDTELQSTLTALYLRHVPASVREFVAMRSDGVVELVTPKPRKPRPDILTPTEVTADEG